MSALFTKVIQDLYSYEQEKVGGKIRCDNFVEQWLRKNEFSNPAEATSKVTRILSAILKYMMKK